MKIVVAVRSLITAITFSRKNIKRKYSCILNSWCKKDILFLTIVSLTASIHLSTDLFPLTLNEYEKTVHSELKSILKEHSYLSSIKVHIS